MTARERLRLTQRTLIVLVIATGLLWAAAVYALVVVSAAAADWLWNLPRDLREWVTPVAATAALAAAFASAMRGRHARSPERVALWIEERVPSLRWALLTLAEPGSERNVAAPMLERVVAAESWRAVLWRDAGIGAVRPAAVLLVAGALLFLMPAGVVARVQAPDNADALDRPDSPLATTPASRLRPLLATITPPDYTGESRRTVEEPAIISGVAGAALVLEGRGRAEGVVASLGENEFRATASGTRWRISLTLADAPVALRLRDGVSERLIAIESRPDSAPVVTLTTPARDTVLRSTTGAMPLAANATDDFGVAEMWFEWIVSSGTGELFTFRSGVLGRSAVSGRRAAGRASLDLASLKLEPGDVVHLRAVARDGNTRTGPSRGASDTRTLRLARASEYDSVAVDPAPPPEVDSSALSQRMLIQMTEALQRRRQRMERSALVNESRRIAQDQARLRRRVSEVVFIRLEGDGEGEHAHFPGDGHDHGVPSGDPSPDVLMRAAEAAARASGMPETADSHEESPILAINRPLLEAYNAMWDAGRELEVGEPGRALPHMYRALEAIQRAREAERVYLRGRPPAVVVDLARVRLAGKREGIDPARRSPRDAVPDPVQRRRDRLAAAVEHLATQPSAAIDSLILLRLDALGTEAPLASALGDAIDALRGGRDATDALVRARRLMSSGATARGSLPRWEAGW